MTNKAQEFLTKFYQKIGYEQQVITDFHMSQFHVCYEDKSSESDDLVFVEIQKSLLDDIDKAFFRCERLI